MKLFLKIGASLLVLFFVFGCFYFIQSLDYEKIADRINAKTAKGLEEQKHLYLIGTGGQMMDDIQMMMMGFNFYSTANIKTARNLLIEAAEKYLLAINSNEKIRPYLHNYPFTDKNIEIVIYFYKPDGSNIDSGELFIAAANRGKIIYYIDCPDRDILKSIYQETYEKALQITLSE